MWIKTEGGALLNLDRAETVEYDDSDNITRAWIGNDCCEICEGDARPFIQSAIIKHETFVRMV